MGLDTTGMSCAPSVIMDFKRATLLYEKEIDMVDLFAFSPADLYRHFVEGVLLACKIFNGKSAT